MNMFAVCGRASIVDFLLSSSLDANAVQPFIVEAPEKAFEHLDVYKNVMFGITSQVLRFWGGFFSILDYS